MNTDNLQHVGTKTTCTFRFLSENIFEIIFVCNSHSVLNSILISKLHDVIDNDCKKDENME